MITVFDTCALIAALSDQEPHRDWAWEQLETCKAAGTVVITDVIYSELSMGMASKEELDEVIRSLGLERLPANDNALFTAGRAYKAYKKEKGANKNNVLPDFFIGASAEEESAQLVTANHSDFAGYFPNLKLVHP